VHRGNLGGRTRVPLGRGGALAEERIAVATQWQLMWWRFPQAQARRRRNDRAGSHLRRRVFADFFAYADPQESDAQRSLIAPQTIHWFDDGSSARTCIRSRARATR
jgi:peptide/nickel transport system permease protein